MRKSKIVAVITALRSLAGLLITAALAANPPLATGANVILAGWDTIGQTGFGVSPLAASSQATNLVVSGLTRGPGVGTGGNAAVGGWGGVGFYEPTAADAEAVGQFATFAITATNGYQVSLSRFSRFGYRRSTTGPPSGVLEFQIGTGNFTNIVNLTYPTIGSGDFIFPIDLSGIAALQNVGATTNVTFRIVNYGGGALGEGTWYIFDTFSGNDLELEGAVIQVLSAPAAAPTLALATFTNHQFTFGLTGTPGTNYVVQASTNLATRVWFPVLTNPAPFTFTETNVDSSPQRFYRAITAP